MWTVLIDSLSKPFQQRQDMKKTSKEWAELILREGELILDPDGWDRKNFHQSYEVEEITIEEFRNRLAVSTVMMNFFDVQQRINNVLAG